MAPVFLPAGVIARIVTCQYAQSLRIQVFPEAFFMPPFDVESSRRGVGVFSQ